MVSQKTSRSATCVLLAVACALAAVVALVVLDVIKVGGSSDKKGGSPKKTAPRGPGAVNQGVAAARKSTTQSTPVPTTGTKQGGQRTITPHHTSGTTNEESGSEDETEDASEVTERTRSSPRATESDATPADGSGGGTAAARTDQTTSSSEEAHSGTGSRLTTNGTEVASVSTATTETPEGNDKAEEHVGHTAKTSEEAHSNTDSRQTASGTSGASVNATTVEAAEGGLENTGESGGNSTVKRGQPSTSAEPEKRSDAGNGSASTEGDRPKTSSLKPGGGAKDDLALTSGLKQNGNMSSLPGERYDRIGGGVTQNNSLSTMNKEPSPTTTGAAHSVEAGNLPSASVHSGEETDEQPQHEGRSGGDIGGPNRLLCTVGSRATVEEMLPPDGLCDRLFYTDVIWRGMAVRGSKNQESWNAFQKAARKSSKTGYGLSIDYGEVDHFFATMMTPMGEQKLREVFEGKIIHYGILKATGRVAQLLEDMHGKLAVLKLLKQLQGQFTQKAPETRANLDLVLGLKFHSYKNRIDGNQHSSAMTALANHLPITMFIVHTHIQDWKNGGYPIIGTVWYYWNEITNTPNEPSLRRTARELNDASIPARTYVMPSFTMMVGEFQKKDNATGSTSDSTYMLKKEFSQLCKSKASVSIVNAGIVKLSAADYSRTYTYEDVETMTAKARAFFNLYHHPHQGWAVFDAEYEDYDNTCGNGAFTRLRAFKTALSTSLSHPDETNKR